MDRAVLTLASPLQRGPNVTAAQKKLNGHNVFTSVKALDPRKGDYLTGAVDGQFGEETARACKRAKFWLGYPDDEIHGSYGHMLDSFLSGEQKLPFWYAQRRAARIKKAGEVSLGEKALKNAIADLGKSENPAGSNNIEFSRWYMQTDGSAWSAAHPGPPYCAMAFSKWNFEAGSKQIIRGSQWAYCPFIVAAARAGSHGLQVVSAAEVKPGDAVLYDWEGNGVADHIGLFEKWIDRSNGYFQTVEANTSPDDSGSQSNGGGVFRRGQAPGHGDTRSTRNVQIFARLSL